MRIPREAIDVAASLSTTGRGDTPWYRERMEAILRAALPILLADFATDPRVTDALSIGGYSLQGHSWAELMEFALDAYGIE